MNRGDVWQVELGGSAGTRPALILTRSAVIPFVHKVTVAEVTRKGKGYPTEVFIDRKANLPHDSFVQLDNIQTIAKERLKKHYGTLDGPMMKTIGRKLILALGVEGLTP